jgi:hypothetical protein
MRSKERMKSPSPTLSRQRSLSSHREESGSKVTAVIGAAEKVAAEKVAAEKVAAEMGVTVRGRESRGWAKHTRAPCPR